MVSEEEERFQRSLINGEINRPVTAEDYQYALGRTALIISDPTVVAVMAGNNEKPETSADLIAYSHENSLTHLNNKEAELQMIDYECQNILSTLEMNEDDFNLQGYRVSQSKQILARSKVANARDGFLLKIVNDQTKVIRTEIQPKKRRFF